MVASLPATSFLSSGLASGAAAGGMSPWMAAMGGPLGLALGGAQIGLSLLGGAQRGKPNDKIMQIKLPSRMQRLSSTHGKQIKMLRYKI